VSVNDESDAQEQWTRCWLVAWSTLARASYSEAKSGNFKPSLAIDVGDDEIRLIDPNTNTFIASAPLSQVTATPAARIGGVYERRYVPNGLPILVVCVPGAKRLTIGCIEPSSRLLLRNGYRFSWRGTVPREKDPAYVVSGAGWVTLVDKFGLASELVDSQPMPPATEPPDSAAPAPPRLYSQPKYASVFQRISVGYLAFCVVFLVTLLIVAAVVHH
jgi:hypothetical protein